MRACSRRSDSGGGELNSTREKRGERGEPLSRSSLPPVFFFVLFCFFVFWEGGWLLVNILPAFRMTAGTGPEVRCRGKQTERVSIPLKFHPFFPPPAKKKACLNFSTWIKTPRPVLNNR